MLHSIITGTRKAIFLHFAYTGRPLAEDRGAVSEDLAVKENIYITQKEKVVKQQKKTTHLK